MFTLLQRIYHYYRPRSANTRNIWWELIDWNEVNPQIWYVNGEIVEA
jgi:hypothetical protein